MPATEQPFLPGPQLPGFAPKGPGPVPAGANLAGAPRPQEGPRPMAALNYVSAKTAATAAYWFERSTLAKKLDGPVLWLVCEICYDYQLEFIFDDSRNRCWVASRQIGKSFALALSAVLQGMVEPRRDQIIISASMDLAIEVMDKVIKHLDVFEAVLGVSMRQKSGTQNKSVVTLPNGSRVISRPASKRTIRSFKGDGHWDEAALTPHDKEIYDAAVGVATRHDFRISMYSTPLGDMGVFHAAARGELAGGFSQHTTTIHDAVRQGCPVDVEEVRSRVNSDTFEQEYECEFKSDLNSYFPWELLHKMKDKGAELLARLTKESDAAGGAARPGGLMATRREWYGGLDVGRSHDLSAQAYGEMWPSEELLVHPTDVLAKAPFPQQKLWFEAGVHVHRPVKVYIDRGGLGMERAEDLEREFPGTVKGIDFSQNQVKRRMVEGLRLAAERGLLGIHPGDRTTLVELHSIKKKLGASTITYVADRTDDGHADRATAVMLCALAAFDGRDGFFAVAGGADAYEDALRDSTPHGPPLPSRMAEQREFRDFVLSQYGAQTDGGVVGWGDDEAGVDDDPFAD